MRTKRAPIRSVVPDPKHGSVTVSRLINYSMRDGKKIAAQKQVYAALDQIAQGTKKQPAELLEEVLDTIAPNMEVRSRRVGGAAYQVPMPVKPRRARSLALRWLVIEANKRSNKEYKTYGAKLAAEMSDALDNAGGAIARRDTSHRMAESNKAFSHFRW